MGLRFLVFFLAGMGFAGFAYAAYMAYAMLSLIKKGQDIG